MLVGSGELGADDLKGGEVTTASRVPGPAATDEEHVELVVDFPERVRRWTVLLRFFLAIPQWIVMIFFTALIWFVVIAAWFAALVLGRLPQGLYEFVAVYLGWSTRFSGYLMLLTDQHPPFSSTEPYPVRVELPAQGELNRLAVLFRFILIIPAGILSSLVLAGWWPVFGVVTWVAELVVGRVPVLLFTTNAALLRYSTRVMAYGAMLTPTYPKKLFGDGRPEEGATAVPTTRPLLLSLGAQILVVVCLVLGLLNLGDSSRQAADTVEREQLASTSGGF